MCALKFEIICQLLKSVTLQVDQLLGPQFREDVVRLEQHVGKRAGEGRQTLLVSATLSERVGSEPSMPALALEVQVT